MIIVGISGGVDSSIAALLLKQQGFKVEGVFMKNWEEDDTSSYCTSSADLEYAEQACKVLDIPLHTVNFSAEYWDNVFDFFLTEFKSGRTPNPDIICNREIKFKVFLEYAKTLGADKIATGHYAKITNLNNKYQLCKSFDQNKDQTYFLHALSQEQLKHAMFPLATLDKLEVRRLAKENNLPNYQKKDSTGICFIGERKFKDFLQTYLPAQPGEIITVEGKQIGRHDGLMYYTIGQRKGLHIGGRQDATEQPWFVIKKDLPKNQLIVAQGNNHPALLNSQLKACNLTWISGQPVDDSFSCTAKIRYRQADQKCQVKIKHNTATVDFFAPQRAITPGQSIVFYDNEVCLGGGIIQ